MLLFLLFGQRAESQQFCTTEPGPGAVGQLSVNQGNFGNTGGPYFIRLYVHVVRRDDGTGGYTPEEVRQALAILDQDFNPHNIFFVWDCGIDYIDSDYYHDNIAISIFFQNPHTDGIDLYLQPPHIGQPNGQGLAGGIPAERLYVFGSINGPPLALSHVLSHEVGHCLGLYHTHHPNDPLASGCHELVNQSNCSSCGDFVCDTPADPNISFNVDNDCEWTGSGNDANGNPYDPDEENIMAYTDLGCMDYFTDGQGERMRQVIATEQVLQDCLVEPDFTGQNIATNTTWTTANTPNNGDFLIEGDLVIEPGATLTISAGVTVRFGEQSRLIIEPDGRLVHFGTLTSMGCRNSSWQGVKVWGSGGGQSQYTVNGVRAQGRIECKQGSLIENAEVGIQLYGPTYQLSGGQISCSGGEVKNCPIGIEFAPYRNFWPYPTSQQGQPRNYFGSMSRMAFSVDGDYPHGAPFHSFVHMTGVNGINLTGCSYVNSMGIDGAEIADWGYGIFANDAGFNVRAAANGNTYPPSSYTNSEFNGLGYGIYTAMVVTNRPYQVRQSDFNNCFVGLRNRGVSGATILHNNFNLGEVPSEAVTTEQAGICFEIGITGFTCQENDFENITGTDALTTIGIFCDNTGDFSKEIRKNTFTGVTVGNLANGQNGANPVANPGIIRGLNYLCNRNFTIKTDGAEFDMASGWVRGKQGLVNPQSVLGHDAAGNEFSPTGTDFINSGAGDIEYFYDQFSTNQTPITIIGNVTPTPADPNECPTEYCEPPCKYQHEIDIIKTEYHDRKGDYLAAQADYTANPTEGKLLEMAGHRQAMDGAAYMVVIHQLYDTVAYHRDTLMAWIGNMNSVSAELWLADLHLASGDAATALQVLDNIPNNYTLSTEEQTDVQSYRAIANILNGQPVYGLDGTTLASVGSYDQSGGNSGGWAQNILTLYGAHYPPRYILSSGIGERSAEGKAKGMDGAAGTEEHLTVQPNPASSHVEFRLRRPSEGGNTRLVIMDMAGRSVREFDVPEGVSSMRWDTGTNPSGIYFYQLIAAGKPLQSGKIILDK